MKLEEFQKLKVNQVVRHGKNYFKIENVRITPCDGRPNNIQVCLFTKNIKTNKEEVFNCIFRGYHGLMKLTDKEKIDIL